MEAGRPLGEDSDSSVLDNEEVAESSNPVAGSSSPEGESYKNVTSFIVSEEPSSSTKPRVRVEENPNDAAMVVPPEDDDEGLDLGASWLEQESSHLPAGPGPVVDAEPALVHPTEPRCTLRGSVSETGVLCGRWGMTQEAHLDPAQTSRFEYRRKQGGAASLAGKSLQEVAVVLSGAYTGHFFLQVAGKNQPVKCDEKQMSLAFAANDAAALNVRGFGKNKYGHFDIEGTCSADLQDLTIFRVYTGKAAPTPQKKDAAVAVPGAPPPRKQSGKDLSRVQAALQSAPAPLKRGASSAHNGGPAAKKAKNSSTTTTKAQPPPPAGPQQLETTSSKRASARPRKAPSHLRTSPEQRTSAAVAQLPEPLRKCHAVVCQLERSPGAHWFMSEVDPVALGVLHYRSIVRSPMDLGTVKRRLEDGLITDVHAFAAEMRLVFRNAVTFNVLPEAPVHEAARDLHDKFEDALKNVWKQLGAAAPSSKAAAEKGKKKKRGGEDDSLGGDALDDDDTFPGERAPSGKRKAAKKKQQPSRGPRGAHAFDGGEDETMIPMTEFVRLQKQMESMQETIESLKKTAAQTEVTLQTSIEKNAAAAKPSAAAKRAAKMKQPLTFQEKAQLSEDINNLPPERLSHVIKIIQERMVLAPTGDSEVEIDIESMDTETLRSLQNYVKTAKRKAKSKAKPPPSSSSSQPVPMVPQLEPTTTLEDIALGAGFAQDDDEDDLAFALGA